MSEIIVGKVTRILIDPNLNVETDNNIFNEDVKTLIFNCKISKIDGTNHYLYFDHKNMINYILRLYIN